MTTVRTFRLTVAGLTAIDMPATTLDEVSHRLPNGAYTTLRIFNKCHVLRLDGHLDRLENSARLLGKPVVLDRRRLRQALAAVLEQTDFPESRVRITVPLEEAPGVEVIIAIEHCRPVDAELYETGVRTATMMITRSAPRAKSTTFIASSRAIKASLPPDIYEVLMVTGDGRLLEGFTSNFFAIMDNRLVTAGQDILEGITRSIVLEIADGAVPIVLRAPRLREISCFDEAFITSSSRGVLPVVAIDDWTVGNGHPGPITQDLRRRYERLVQAEAAPPVT